MPQWRKLHVKAVDSRDINDMPDDFTRLLWLLMPLGLDREGRGIDDSSWVRSKLMPMRRDVTFEMIDAAMAWFAERGMIVRYEVGGACYFCVPTFAEYQGKTDREAESKIPAQVLRKTKKGLEKVMTNSRPTLDPLPPKSMTDVDSDSDADTDAKVEGMHRQKAADKPPRHPALLAYQEAAKTNPDRSQNDTIIATVGERPADLDFWGQVVTSYCLLGWNKRNVANMLEYFQRHELPATNKPSRNGNGVSAVGQMLAYAEELKRGDDRRS